MSQGVAGMALGSWNDVLHTLDLDHLEMVGDWYNHLVKKVQLSLWARLVDSHPNQEEEVAGEDLHHLKKTRLYQLSTHHHCLLINHLFELLHSQS